MGSDSIRAVRNNNPGNIEKGAPWQGLMPPEEMSEEQNSEKRFAVFKSPLWGFRALATTLITYQDKRRAPDGSIIDTVEEAITRWAPPSENDTEAYIKRVCKLTGFERRDALDFHKYDDAAPLVKAIATVECGGWFFNDEDLDVGLDKAGVAKSPQALVASGTVKAATLATAATSLSLVSEAVQQVAPASGFIREVSGYAPQVAGILVIMLCGYIIFKLYDDWRRKSR